MATFSLLEDQVTVAPLTTALLLSFTVALNEPADVEVYTSVLVMPEVFIVTVVGALVALVS